MFCEGRTRYRRRHFHKAMKGSHLPSEWRLAKGYHEEELVIQARYADLLVLGQTEPNRETLTSGDLPETVAISSGRATLVVPHIGVRSKPGKSIMLCWNASRESARAAAEALPFLVVGGKGRRPDRGHKEVWVEDTAPSPVLTLPPGSPDMGSTSPCCATLPPTPTSEA